ncbi:MraY family glycosyltransferase [Algoriphagus taiwanensis]|uniref:Glycosyltransferase family 4 protein n=1 Tax=Algoriphagus taiwanensis TaxID=1445656 RepID=A0ABQ6Q2I6_9BACT|nr:glycosyltransferase family 4 protein [Algoriphagus taiwanensis]
MFLSHLIVFLILLLLALVYYRLALQFNIVDKPNHRSSHTQVTVRGGGILFPFAVLLWWMANDFLNTWMVLGMVWIAAISLLDDIYTLSRKIRFGVQILALSMAFYDLGVFEQVQWIGLPALYFVCLGIINAINFMDGINGITGLYGLVFFGTILAINQYMPVFDPSLIYYVILSLSIFMIFNFRKRALMFAGDIGSISLAFLMIYILVQFYLVVHTWTIIVLLAVYGVDVAATMIERKWRGEKLGEPHRRHLYQLMVNQLKVNHVNIAMAFAFIQAIINFALFIIPDSYPSPIQASGILLALVVLYLLIKTSIWKKLHTP